MSRYFSIFAAVCVAVSAAPPPAPRLYQQQAPAHFHTSSPVDYFMDNSEVAEYYNSLVEPINQATMKPDTSPARLENLEPDSEVELIPGAQQPQQPPQQNPVNPNVPGLVPGQRGVFIVHMPVPGLRPGTIGGYQPVYIVAAAPQGNTAYAGNGLRGVQGVPGGFQNAILVNPAAVGPGQVVSPFFGFPGAQAQFPGAQPQFQGAQPQFQGVQAQYPGAQAQFQGIQAQYPGLQAQYPRPQGPQAQYPVGQQAGLLFGAAPLQYRGFQPVYQQQINPGLAYQQLRGSQQQQGPRGGVVQLSQLIGLQQAQPEHPANNQQRSNEAAQNAEQKRIGEASETVESKDALTQRNARPAPAHPQRNNKE